MKKCLACYEILKNPHTQEYHERCSKKIFGTPKAPILDYTFNQISELAKQVLAHRLAIPGVQPKLSLSINKPNVETDSKVRLTIVGLWDGIYVLKPPNKKYPELPENEDVTMHMAESCGIETAMHSLIRFKSGEIAYLAKRFDRRINKKKKIVEKFHQEDMCQLTGVLTEEKYHSSMEKVAKAIINHTTNKGLEGNKLFEVTVYSFLTGNADMHLKNFSILINENNSINLTPAYDLLATKLATPDDKEELALTMGGKKNKLTKDNFLTFAQSCQMPAKAAENTFRRFEKNLPKMALWIKKSFLSDEMKDEYLNLILERSKRLGLKAPENFLNMDVE
jgi:serine/threonine-protein kinase HipA